MADVSLLLDWLAFLSIALISITVPTYAISVTFLGRAARKVRQGRERKLKELSKALEEKSRSLQSGLPLQALEKEIENYKRQIEEMEGKLSSLSARGAALIPLFAFSASFVLDCVGLLYHLGIFVPAAGITPDSAALNWVAASIAALLVGATFFIRTLYAIDFTAKGPETLTEFRVSFENGSPAQRFSPSQQGVVNIIVHNWGKDMGESVLVNMYFPREFEVLPPPPPLPPMLPAPQYTVSPQPSFPYPPLNYPGAMTLGAYYPEMHEDILQIIEANLVMPAKPGKYKVPVCIWEKKLGKTIHELFFEIQ